MIRGTTQQFRFELPYHYSELVNLKIAFWQEDNQGTGDYKLPIIKSIENDDKIDISDDGNAVYVTLNVKETLAFECDKKAYVQLWATTQTNAFGSHAKQFTVYPMNSVLLEGVVDEER